MSQIEDISDVLDDDTLTELSPGTNVLISGPPMSGKQHLALNLLAAGHETGDGVLCVTTKNSAADVLDELETQVPTLRRGQVGIIDCSGSMSRNTIEGIATLRVPSPGDLTGISIGTAKLLQRFTNQDVSTVRHGLVSVSTLLKYLDLDTVIKFLHIYTVRIRDTQGLGVFTIDTLAHDQKTVNAIVGEFDGVVELRETDAGDREIRVRGFGGRRTGWRPYP
jgi:archaellum biogenesis ATPase FlaH